VFERRRLAGAVRGADQERVILTRGAAFEGDEAASVQRRGSYTACQVATQAT
jgi:hypothetical protein